MRRWERLHGRTAALAMALLVGFLPSAQSQFPPGDVNGDGSVNYWDGRAVVHHLLEKTPLSGAALARADANGDGKISLADATWIAGHPTETTITLPGNVPLVLVRIPAGSCIMGSPPSERGRWEDEGPTRTVTIARPFYLGKFEITQQQWLTLMTGWPDSVYYPNPIFGLGDQYPAYYVSWNDVQDFLAALNAHIAKTAQGAPTFRLPSEAEWEYACRAGMPTRFFFGDSLGADDGAADAPAGTLPGNRADYMWFTFNCSGGPNGAYGNKPAGSRRPNPFGLYDMSGSVWEWCQDWYHPNYVGAPTDGTPWESPAGKYRVVRGGNWYRDAHRCRSAARTHLDAVTRYGYLGFRVISSL